MAEGEAEPAAWLGPLYRPVIKRRPGQEHGPGGRAIYLRMVVQSCDTRQTLYSIVGDSMWSRLLL